MKNDKRDNSTTHHALAYDAQVRKTIRLFRRRAFWYSHMQAGFYAIK